MEYSRSAWDKVPQSTTLENFYNQSVYGIGLEILPRSLYGSSVGETLVYRFGMNYDTGYYRIKSYDINIVEVKMGIGLNLNRTLQINLNYGYGLKGLQKNTPIKENYHMLNLGINFLELWFMKRQID